MPLEPRASWFSPKCVEAQQLTGHLGVKHCFGAGRESGTKSRQTLNTRYDLKITRVKVNQIQCLENLRVPPQGSSTEGESGPKIRPKGVVDGQQDARCPCFFRVRRGRENASSQCSSTRCYGAEVIHAILPGKARTTFNKRVPVPETDTDHVWGLTPAQCRKVKEVGDLMTGEPATEAPVNGGRNYNGPKVEGEEGLLPGGPEPSVRYHSGRARILTLCQDLRAKGQSQGRRSTDKSYSRDNRLIFPKSSHRREGLAPRCRLFATWGCSMFQGLGCSPIKAVRELGSERRETVRSISGVGVRALRGPFPSTRGPGRTHLWCASYRAHGKRWVAKCGADNC
ncbi:hypothetical protein VNO77_49528 [Canavalia gladiata]